MAYVINPDEYVDVGTSWIALYALINAIIYFGGLRVKHVPNETKHFIGNKNIKTYLVCHQIIK